jgi:hypothetical protein
MEAIRHLDKWHQTRFGLLIFGLVELGASYGFACLSIDIGNLLLYLLTLILFVGAIKNLIHFSGALLVHGH